MIIQSLWVLIVFAGLVCPKCSLKSSNDSLAWLSVTVVCMLERMTLKLTAFPWRILTHSKSGNSGGPLLLNRLCLVTLVVNGLVLHKLPVSS